MTLPLSHECITELKPRAVSQHLAVLVDADPFASGRTTQHTDVNDSPFVPEKPVLNLGGYIRNPSHLPLVVHRFAHAIRTTQRAEVDKLFAIPQECVPVNVGVTNGLRARVKLAGSL